MSSLASLYNFPKPKVFTQIELDEFIRNNKLQTGRIYPLPPLMSYSDEQLKSRLSSKWLTKRDEKFEMISYLTNTELIDKYLFGKGLGKEILQLIKTSNKWKSAGSYHNALNRYITFGMTKNSLLSFKSKNIGANFNLPAIPDELNTKRGCCGKDNRNSRTRYRGVTALDKKRIKKLAVKCKNNNKKFSISNLYKEYQDEFEVTYINRIINGKDIPYSLPLPENKCISLRQFSYHLKKVINKADLLKIKVGDLRFEKDFKDTQGTALDGVLGATFRYEVDATVLDLYVRFPFSKEARFSMGRPVLYLVIDVYSSMICGFYLGFDGPNHDGVTQALVNACTDKVAFAARYNEVITHEEWPVRHIPNEITVDNGREYPNSLFNSMLKSQLGITAANFTAVYRGDAKGTVESTFNVANNSRIHFEPGSIFKDIDRTEQHPSNRAFWDYDALVRKLIRLMIETNKTSTRLKKLNFQAMVDDIGLSPEAIFLHSLEKDMNDKQPVKREDEMRIRWAFLPEMEASVRDDCIYFQQLEYHHPFFKQERFYERAANHGWFKITVKCVKDWVNNIFYQTDSGEFIVLELKNPNNSSPFLNLPWEIALHQFEWLKIKIVEHDRYTKEIRQHFRSLDDVEFKKITKELFELPESYRKSIVPFIKENKDTAKKLATLKHAHDVFETIGIAIINEEYTADPKIQKDDFPEEF